MNLWKETEDVLAENDLTMNDVVWVGTAEVEIPLDRFKELAKRVYDSGYGSPEVATDLVVCGADWWLERHEYDGSEWWELKRMPVRPTRVVRPERVLGGAWSTLKELNNPNGRHSDEPWDWEGCAV